MSAARRCTERSPSIPFRKTASATTSRASRGWSGRKSMMRWRRVCARSRRCAGRTSAPMAATSTSVTCPTVGGPDGRVTLVRARPASGDAGQIRGTSSGSRRVYLRGDAFNERNNLNESVLLSGLRVPGVPVTFLVRFARQRERSLPVLDFDCALAVCGGHCPSHCDCAGPAGFTFNFQVEHSPRSQSPG
eukprot:1810526-Rhodomonas_salina.1